MLSASMGSTSPQNTQYTPLHFEQATFTVDDSQVSSSSKRKVVNNRENSWETHLTWTVGTCPKQQPLEGPWDIHCL